MTRGRGSSLRIAALTVASSALLGAASAGEEVQATFRKILTAPEARARMTIERSDPFGGPRSRERGLLWLLPGRGLRYRSTEKGGQELSIDRTRETFLLYSPSERMIYRAPYVRAPARLRRLIAEPERFLSGDLRATPERRRVGAGERDGYRLRSASLGDSLPEVSVWLSRDSGSGFPRWIVVSSSTDTVWVEFRDWTLLGEAHAADLAISAPRATPETPLDPRELLNKDGDERSR